MRIKVMLIGDLSETVFLDCTRLLGCNVYDYKDRRKVCSIQGFKYTL